MEVLKVVVKAPVTSFRYPHFLIGQQITFDMPPPSTIFGHVASALGELPERDFFRFAYCFRYQARSSDLEHQHVISAGGKRSTFRHEGAAVPVNVDGIVQPHLREFLFQPELTLYVDNLELKAAFQEPMFCVALGRSQDLAEIQSVEIVSLQKQQRAYLEDTILPFSMRMQLSIGTTVLMPRYIGPAPQREAEFDRYIVLRDRVFCGQPDDVEQVATIRRLLQTKEPLDWWVDPSTEEWQGAQRGLCFHSFS